MPSSSLTLNDLSRRSGLLVVGHGTKDSQGTAQFFELVKELRSDLRDGGHRLPVAASLLEFHENTIATGWQELVTQDVEHIVVAPLLLFAAGHARQDIPSQIESLAAACPHVTWEQSRPLSRHPSIVELVTSRVMACWQTTPTARTIPANRLSELDPSFRLVMVGRGSHDPCARADMLLLSEMVGWRLGCSHVRTAFYAMAQPRLPEVLDEVASSQGSGPIVVYPHLLFTGRLFAAIERQVREAQERNPATEFRLAKYLGPDQAVARAIAGRAMEGPRAAVSSSSPRSA